MSTTFSPELLFNNSIHRFFLSTHFISRYLLINHLSTDLFSFLPIFPLISFHSTMHSIHISPSLNVNFSFNSTAQSTNHFQSTLSIYSYFSFNELCSQISYILVKSSPYLFSPSIQRLFFFTYSIPRCFFLPNIRQKSFYSTSSLSPELLSSQLLIYQIALH